MSNENPHLFEWGFFYFFFLPLKSFTIPITPKEHNAPITNAEPNVIISLKVYGFPSSFDHYEVGVRFVFLIVYPPTRQLKVLFLRFGFFLVFLKVV